MYVLNMNEPDMRLLKKSLPQIAHKKMMARGSFSVVYRRDRNSVWKLTCDKANYELAIKMSCMNPHFQEVLEDIGEVGEVHGEPVYLFAIEELRPLPRDHELGKQIIKSFTKRFENLGMLPQVRTRGSENASVAQSMSYDHSLPTYLRDALSQLAEHVKETGYSLDMAQMANMMMRGSDTLVFTDPIFDEEFSDRVLEECGE